MMAKVTLYEYDGETRHESGVSVNWRQVGEPLGFESREQSFDECLCDEFPFSGIQDVDWSPPQRVSKRVKAYEAETDDRPLYRAEVEE